MHLVTKRNYIRPVKHSSREDLYSPLYTYKKWRNYVLCSKTSSMKMKKNYPFKFADLAASPTMLAFKLNTSLYSPKANCGCFNEVFVFVNDRISEANLDTQIDCLNWVICY